MIEKVAYMCAIMVAVQSRTVLYGTSILNSVTSSTEIDEAHHRNISRYETEEESGRRLDSWEYSIYDLGTKFLRSIRRNVELKNLVNDVSSPNTDEVSSSLSSPKLNVVSRESVTENDGSQDTGIDSVQILLSGNESLANSELFGISKWHFAKDIIHREVPGLAAFGYNN